MAVYFVDQCSFFANGSRMGIEFTIYFFSERN